MKSVKIVNGIKKIEDSDPGATLFRLRDVLSEHRSVLISRLVGDLSAYIDYKFSQKVTGRRLDSIKDSLQLLKNSTLDLDRYRDIVEHFYNHEMTYIGTEAFMKEIDETISMALNSSQLKLVE